MNEKTKYFIDKAIKIHGDKYDYSKVNYVNNHSKVCIICPKHGEFWQTPSHHLRKKGCLKCGKSNLSEKFQLTTDEFIEKARKIHGNKYDYSKVKYNGYETYITIICPKHGEFLQSPDSHLHSSGCPKCSNKQSNLEENIINFLKKITDSEIYQRARDIISPYELDIYIPHKKIAIEHDGLIWHSEKFNKNKDYHLIKTELCEKQGIRLIHIFEDEWLEHEDIVKSKLKHILGYDTDLPKVFARKCAVNEINYNDAKVFLIKNHIQGACNSTVYLGCYFNNELVGVMTFKKERKDSNKWELTRFATDITKHCIGVGGKLFKYFINNYNPLEVKSFADRRWSVNNDNLYIKLGFELNKNIEPDYYYITNRKRIHKFNFRKHILLKKYPNSGLTEDMTEYEMTQKLGFYRIWDCGLYKYVWKK